MFNIPQRTGRQRPTPMAGAHWNRTHPRKRRTFLHCFSASKFGVCWVCLDHNLNGNLLPGNRTKDWVRLYTWGAIYARVTTVCLSTFPLLCSGISLPTSPTERKRKRHGIWFVLIFLFSNRLTLSVSHCVDGLQSSESDVSTKRRVLD